MKNPVRYFNNSPEVIRLAVMMYIRYPLSLRQVEDLPFERGTGRLPEFPVPYRKFPVTPIKFPVPILREFVANLLI